MSKLNFILKVLSVPLDLLAIFLAFVWAYQIRADGQAIYQWPYDEYIRAVLYILPIWLVVFALLGLYSLRSRQGIGETLLKIIIGSFTGWAIFIALLYFSRTDQTQTLPRLIPLYLLALIPLAVATVHLVMIMLEKMLYSLGISRVKVVILGNSSDIAKSLKKQLTTSATGYHYQGTIESESISEIILQLQKVKPQELWVTSAKMLKKDDQELLNFCEAKKIIVKVIPETYDIRTLNVRTFYFSDVLFIELGQSPLEGWGRIIKKIFDLTFSLLVLILVSPIMFLVALGVKLSSRGPIIYRQQRIGRDGEEFAIYKFRSMYIEEDRSNKSLDWSLDEDRDTRITPFGRFIRRTMLDELPQVFNVLFGSMSWVGPRPEQPNYVQKFTKSVRNYAKRHYVKSGITGWAQVNGLRGDTSIEERIRFDLFYIQNWSILFDLKIFLMTFSLALTKIFTKR